MDNQKEECSVIKVSKYRWVILFVFCLINMTNFMQLLEFTIISNVIKKFYQVDSTAVDATALIFFVVYILLFLPVSYLIENYSLRVTGISSITFTLAGNMLKVFSNHRDRFYIVLIGQGLVAIAQVYLMSIPSKFASTWFGPNEVSTACAIAILGSQLGVAIGSVLPPFIVKDSMVEDNISDDIYNMTLYNAILSFCVFIIVLIFFKAKPSLPPSQSQLQLMQNVENQPSFFACCKTMLKNKDYLLVWTIFGILNGIWNSFGILVNTIYLTYFPNGEKDVGVMTLLATISGGCLGSIVFGKILDKTHEFKKTSLAVGVFSIVTFALMSVTTFCKFRIPTFITVPLCGFFMASFLVISFEYALEVTYPIPESVSCSVLNTGIFVFAIAATLVLEALFVAIGIIYSFVCILIVMSLCTLCLSYVSTNLRRREANMAMESSDTQS